jgi:PHD/YefM family antitoxin component YafN of YafNO toxin-antitoxin module
VKTFKRQDAARVSRNVKNSTEPLFITRRGRATAVVRVVAVWQSAQILDEPQSGYG